MSVIPTPNVVSVTSSVLPQNQGFVCSGSSLSATQQLAIQQAGNKGFYGFTLNSLYMISLLVPNADSTVGGDIQSNGLNQAGTTTLQINTSASRSIQILPKVLYTSSVLDAASVEPLTVKKFKSIIPLKGGTISQVAGTLCYLAVKVLDPSTCDTPSNVFPSSIDVYADSKKVTKLNPTYQASLTFTGGFYDIISVTPYYFPSLNSFTGLNIDSDPADWILIQFSVPATGSPPATWTNTTLTLYSYIPSAY
jgi:hypothetical protein